MFKVLNKISKTKKRISKINSNLFSQKINNIPKKTLAIPLKTPVFPITPVQLELNQKKMSYIDYYLQENNFLTIIYPKQKNITDYFKKENYYPLGSYCKIEKLNDNIIGLRTINKIDIIDINGNFVDYENPNDAEDTLKKELGILKKDKLELEINSDKNDFKSSNCSDMNEDVILFSEVKELDTFDFENLDFDLRVKIDNLVELTRNISAPRSGNTSYTVNYSDFDDFLENLGVLSLQTGLFTDEQILPLYVTGDFGKRIEAAFEIVEKMHAFSNRMRDIGKIAERNIQMRKQKEISNEIYNVVKNIAKKDQITPIDKVAEEFSQKNAPKHVLEIFEENLQRIKDLDKSNQEYNVIMNYMKWIACLPFGQQSEENYDLIKAKKILDDDHYGLKDVKDRVLEFLAIGKIKNSVKGKILCLEGPPGVGKTSFAYSVAKVLNREVFRISLGGENDISVLKGHRKTYIGSKPGKIIEALKMCKNENCVIIIDEIDKTAQANVFGDPQSTLLEILDPEQNNSFVDNFLDFPVDLSNVFFICTANNTQNISQPLLDRMDLVTLSSYTNLEKSEIYKKYLLPKAIENTGLENYKDLFVIEEDVVFEIIDGYSREAGIRSLQKNTNKLLEKIAFKIIEFVEKSENTEIEDIKLNFEKIVITKKNLKEYLGAKIFDKDDLYDKLIPGVVKGLAYNNFGGSVLYIETSLSSKKQKQNLKLTGKLGDVMKESMNIAYSFTRNFLKKKFDNNFLEKHEIHVHVPEGATPKDGPSAGAAFTTSLLSLALKKSINKKIGMTGEISLKGKIMKIGGLKEKVLAAKREGLEIVVLPEDNKETVEELPEEIKEGMEFVFVDYYEDVYSKVF